jgi:hypothetical protein
VIVLLILTISKHTSVRLAEVAFVLILLVGVWLMIAGIPQLKRSPLRLPVAGVGLALAGLLLLVATHWGHFG